MCCWEPTQRCWEPTDGSRRSALLGADATVLGADATVADTALLGANTASNTALLGADTALLGVNTSADVAMYHIFRLMGQGDPGSIPAYRRAFYSLYSACVLARAGTGGGWTYVDMCGSVLSRRSSNTYLPLTLPTLPSLSPTPRFFCFLATLFSLRQFSPSQIQKVRMAGFTAAPGAGPG